MSLPVPISRLCGCWLVCEAALAINLVAGVTKTGGQLVLWHLRPYNKSEVVGGSVVSMGQHHAGLSLAAQHALG